MQPTSLDRRPAPCRSLGASLLLALLVALVAPLPTHAQEPITALGVAANNILNWSFETFEGNDVRQRVAQYWDPFVLSGNTVEFRQGTQFAGINVERIDGLDSQIIKSDDPFDAGVYQVIPGLRTGEWYSVVAYVLTIFQTSAVSNPSDFDGTMVKQLGVDPTGGRNPLSAEVIWGPPVDKNMDRATWGQRLTFQATGTSATFYIRVQALQGVSHPSYDNLAFIDGAQLRLAPIAQATVPETAPAGPFNIDWKAVVPLGTYPTEGRPFEYDVQFRDSGGDWQGWLWNTRSTSATFTDVIPGHEYSFRVRAWAQYFGTALQGSYCEMFGPWAESAAVRLGQVVEATALDNRGHRVAEVPFQLKDSNGTVVSTRVTDGTGHAYLGGAEGQSYSVVALNTWYLAPPPIYDVVIGAGIQPVTVTIAPPDDLMPDGSFESLSPGALPDGWSASGPTVQASDYRYHTGHRSLALRTDPQTPGVCLTRTFSLNEMYSPVFSFWYRLEPGQQGMQKVLSVRLLDPQSAVLAYSGIQSQTPTGWLHSYLAVTSSDILYSGEVTVEICLRDREGSPTTYETVAAYVDDFSLGRSSGGPYRTLLPAMSQSVAP